MPRERWQRLDPEPDVGEAMRSPAALDGRDPGEAPNRQRVTPAWFHSSSTLLPVRLDLVLAFELGARNHYGGRPFVRCVPTHRGRLGGNVTVAPLGRIAESSFPFPSLA
jgi:hypothetical protein